MSIIQSPAPLAPAVVLAPTPSPSSWTFTQGLLIGQASFVILFLLFVRYVVFSPAEAIDQEEWKRRRDLRAKKAVLSTTAVPAPPPGVVLSKTGYEMATHPAESTGWVNVLFGQILQGYRNDLLSGGGEEGARQKIQKWLNPDKGQLSWIDPIEVTALSLGSAYPLLSNARIRPADGQGRIRAEIDMDYADAISLSLSTSVLINFPRPRFAVLPVSLGVELVSIGGTLSVQIHDPADAQQQLHVCLLPDFHLNLKTTTLLGSRAKLQDVPKLEQLIVTRLRAIIQDRLVHPNHLTLSLPRLQSSSANSSKPIITELGERAIDAVRDGIAKAATDFVSIESPSTAPSTQAPDTLLPSPPASPPPGPRPAIGGKKITMPAGFPRSNYASSSVTPLQTPGGPNSTSAYNNNQYSDRGLAAGTATPSINQYKVRQPRTSGAASLAQSSSVAMTPGVPTHAGTDDPAFRFRGQFASRAPTPGGGGYHDEVNGESRRMGALNSKAS